MRKRFGAIAVGTVLVGIASLVLLFAAQLSWAAEMNPEEQAMLQLVNQERAARGLSILSPDPRMTDLARQHSEEMVNLKYFAHESPVSGSLLNRILASRVEGWMIAGENLAGAPSVQIAHDALMKSEKHKENILNAQYTHLGIGIIDGGPYGKMFSQEFIGYANASSVNYGGSIQGRVVDYAGRPIVGAVVRINGTVLPTNGNGEFRFTLVQPGTYTIFYDAAGFLSQVQEGIAAEAGQTSRPPQVIMSPVNGQKIGSIGQIQQSTEVAGKVERNHLVPKTRGRLRSRRHR